VRGENGLSLDLPEAFDAIAGADVVVLGFPHLQPRVLFDLRPGFGTPFIRLVPPARTAEERIGQLRRLRPGVPDPERFVFVRWPLGVDSLIESGLWEALVNRAERVLGERALAECDGVMQRLRTLDARETREAIAGESYRYLWPKRPF